MRFRRWHRPEPYGDTSRKRAAFLRKQRLEREALPLFAGDIAAGQHGVDEEMARRAVWWDEAEREHRDQRAVWWRKGRARLFTLPDGLRARVREIWRTCPYPADPASFADFLHQITVGKLDPWCPPWQFHPERTARITRDPSTFGEAFRRIGGRKAGIGPSAPVVDESLYCGNLGSGILFLRCRLRPVEAGENVHIVASHHPGAAQRLEIEVRGACLDAELALIERLAQATETRPVVVQRVVMRGQP
ncbi:hypothetical protein [Shinella granuli]|jgi:hypothetical protein|uniref:Uncharacterized protein n=1 Tax=Shinella granuli TaxID=323621 RepID=A0A4R2C898_SHIGR|nr:hypothetical protein [Shinella granuli]OYX68455.1 MAG: hypothetical protein B7Y95_20515 [Rhizobiales bacterium 32-66-11]OYY09141.1 MAG: hypothetical protein B7Y70_10710 [Rhizobiales bacterium 35-68-8]TCN36005.1 hypothetical protein EV665_12575 [Shinella granuli]